MSDWPLDGNPVVAAGGITAVSNGVSVTSGTANVKTAAAVQLWAATPFEASAIIVQVRSKAGAGDYFLDILAGASGSEQVLIPNLYYGGAVNTVGSNNWMIPIDIPAGTRLSLKTQSSSATSASTFAVQLVANSFVTNPGLSQVAALGIVTSTTRGKALTAPGTADVYPGWVLIGRAPFNAHFIIPVLGQQAITIRTTAQRFCAQVALGEAAAEQVILDGAPFGVSSTSSLTCHVGMPYPLDIPAGTAISMRYASSALTTLGADGIVYLIG